MGSLDDYDVTLVPVPRDWQYIVAITPSCNDFTVHPRQPFIPCELVQELRNMVASLEAGDYTYNRGPRD